MLKRMSVGLAVISGVLLLACQDYSDGPENELPIFNSIKDVKIQGPGAKCSDIESVLKHSPSDMSTKHKQIAELSREACRLSVGDVSLDDVKTALNGEKLAYAVDGETLTIYGRNHKDTAFTCCSIQADLDFIGSDQDIHYFASRFHLKNLDAARLEFFAPDYFESEDKYKINFIGPNAFADRAMNTGELNGKLTEGIFESRVLKEKRIYDLYIPPGFETGEDVGLVVMGDGRSLGFHVREWEPLMMSGELGSFVVIGVRSGQRAISEPKKDYDFDVRNADYIKGYSKGPQRFEAHLEFVSDELIPHVKAELEIAPSAERTVLMGGSSGGSFALWGVMSRPDVFGIAIGNSPSSPIPEEISMLAAKRKYYLSAGYYEPGFRYNAEAYHAFFNDNAVSSELKLYSDGHSNDSRAQRMVELLPIIFPGR